MRAAQLLAAQQPTRPNPSLHMISREACKHMSSCHRCLDVNSAHHGGSERCSTAARHLSEMEASVDGCLQGVGGGQASTQGQALWQTADVSRAKRETEKSVDQMVLTCSEARAQTSSGQDSKVTLCPTVS
jgi:hypothetical protein